MNRSVAVFLSSPLGLSTTSCDSVAPASTKARCTLEAGGGGEHANGAGADSVRYEIIPFRSNVGSGTRTIAGISSCEGRELNRFSVVFDGTPDCPGYPTDTECRE